MVRFDVLGDLGVSGPKRRSSRATLVNWSEIEQRIQTSEKAYQRPILRKKVDELATYYLQCRDDAAVPAIPGAVLLTTEQPIRFSPQDGNPFVGLLEMSEEEGALRVVDGQHRLLALAALLGASVAEQERAAASTLQVPAILFSGLPAPSVVEMFVTINSKHTRLNASLLYELKGRQLYAEPIDARVHDIVHKLNADASSPLAGEIKMLGVGPGRVAQAGLAQELRRVLVSVQKTHAKATWLEDFMSHAERFYLAYFREMARVLADAWASKTHATRSLIALRAFLQVSEEVIPKVMDAGGDPRASLRALLAPWADRIGARRFETAGAWRENLAGGGKETTRKLARELADALGSVS